MKRKATEDFTPEEKEMMDTIAINYILAQSDGFQLGYAQALSDFTASIIDYWKGSDDEPQQSILDMLIDLGVELGKRQEIAKKNIETATERGYENYYHWEYKDKEMLFGKYVNLFTKAEDNERNDLDESEK